MTPVDKYAQRARDIDSLLCVGLDSAIDRLPERARSSSTPQYDFNRWIIEQTHEYAAAYKPNIAFYEARGSAGLRDLELTMQFLADNLPDVFTICDAKRADIGSTNDAYVHAIFDSMGFDAVTLHPYLSREALTPFLDREDKVSIILCRTSNPGAPEIQDLPVNGEPLWQHIARKVSAEWNTNHNCMLVFGATYAEDLRTARRIVGDMTLLVPGIGTQGGDVQAVVDAGINADGAGLIINASRSIIFAEHPQQAAKDFCDQINTARKVR